MNIYRQNYFVRAVLELYNDKLKIDKGNNTTKLYLNTYQMNFFLFNKVLMYSSIFYCNTMYIK